MVFTLNRLCLTVLLLVWSLFIWPLQTVSAQNQDFWDDKNFLHYHHHHNDHHQHGHHYHQQNSSRSDTIRNVGITQTPLSPTQQPLLQMNIHPPQIPPPLPAPPMPPLPPLPPPPSAALLMPVFKHEPYRWQLPAPPSAFHSVQERSQMGSSRNSNQADAPPMSHSSLKHNGMQSSLIKHMSTGTDSRALQQSNPLTSPAPKPSLLPVTNNAVQTNNKDNLNLFNNGFMQSSASNYRLNTNALPLIVLPPPPPLSPAMAELMVLNNIDSHNNTAEGISESSPDSAVLVNQQSPLGKRLNEMLLQNRLQQLHQQQVQQTLLQLHSPLMNSLQHLTLPTSLQSAKQMPNRMQEDYDEEEEPVSQNSLPSGRSINAGNTAIIHLSTSGDNNRAATTESNDNDLNNEIDQEGDDETGGGGNSAEDNKKRNQLRDSMNMLMLGRIPTISGGSPSFPLLSASNGGVNGFQPSILLRPTPKSPSNGLQTFTIGPSIFPFSPLAPGSLSAETGIGGHRDHHHNGHHHHQHTGPGQLAASQPVYYLIMPPTLGNGLLDDSLDIGDALTGVTAPSVSHKRRRQHPQQNPKQQNKTGAWWHRLLPERIRNNLAGNSKETGNGNPNGNNNAASSESGENGGNSASSLAATGPAVQYPFAFTAAELQGAGALRKPMINYPAMPLYTRPSSIGLETNLLSDFYAQPGVSAQIAGQPMLGQHPGQHFYQPAFFAPMDDQHAVGNGAEEDDDEDDNGSNGEDGNHQNGHKPPSPNRLVDRMRNWWKNIFRRPEAHGRPDGGGGGGNGGSHPPGPKPLPTLSLNGASAHRLMLVTPNE